MNEPVSDLFLRIRNALLRRKDIVDMSSSYLKEQVVRILVDEGFLLKYEVLTRGSKKMLRITLKYGLDKFGKPSNPVIRRLKTVSKSGGRVYSGAADIPSIEGGFGLVIMSTPQGVMTGSAAASKNIGGEILGYVY